MSLRKALPNIPITALVLAICSWSVTFAQSVTMPAEAVDVTYRGGHLVVAGLETPTGTVDDLVLSAAVPAFDAASEIVIGGTDGDRRIAVPHVRSFVGAIRNDPGSIAALTYVDNRLFGLIQLSGGETWVVQRDLNSPTYSVAGVPPNAFSPTCGVIDTGSLPISSSVMSYRGKSGLKELELAVETDTEFFKNTGGVDQKSIEYLAALISTVSAIYQRDIGVVIKVVWARVWTDSPRDPYNVAGNPFTLSDKVKANWSAYDTVERDLFHIITASASGGGGFAYHDALCSDNSTAHGATSIQGWNNLAAPGFNYDTYIVSHEIGHNFNARHTHSCYYGAPLDTCEVDQAIQEGCLPAGQHKKPNPGSIMSYCGWTNLNAGFGYVVEMNFRDVVKAGMIDYAGTVDCLAEFVLATPLPYTPDGDTLRRSDVEFRWSATQPGSYDLEIRGDTVYSGRVLDTTTTLRLADGAYEWRIRSTTVGADGEWSAWLAFVVSNSVSSVEATVAGSRSVDLW